MVRKSKLKGGKKNMKTDQRRVTVVPLWREDPDARLFAQAVVELARARRKDAKQPMEVKPDHPEADHG
jgi:hypothetical protein